MIKLILFDFDGTVIDGSEGIYNSIKYALGKMGLPLPEKNILRRFIGPSLFDGFMKYCAADEKKADEFISLYRERYAPIGYAEARLYDGIAEVLVRLREMGYKIGICSSKPLEFVVKISQMLGIYELADNYFCPGFSTHTSEKHELILEGARYFGVSCEETLIIGDTHFDIDAAKRAGVHSLGVLYGFSVGNELERCGADRVVAHVEDIVSAVEEMK